MSFVKHLNWSQIVEIQKQTHSLWGDGLSLDQRLEKLKSKISAGYLLSLSGLLDHQGDVVASVKRYKLNLRFEKRTLKTLGLGAIFTSPSHRGQGHAKQLIETVLQDACEDGFEASLLFSEIGPHYYAKFGFVEVPLSAFSFDVSPPAQITAMIASLDAGVQLRNHDPSLFSFGSMEHF